MEGTNQESDSESKNTIKEKNGWKKRKEKQKGKRRKSGRRKGRRERGKRIQYIKYLLEMREKSINFLSREI